MTPDSPFLNGQPVSDTVRHAQTQACGEAGYPAHKLPGRTARTAFDKAVIERRRQARRKRGMGKT